MICCLKVKFEIQFCTNIRRASKLTGVHGTAEEPLNALFNKALDTKTGLMRNLYLLIVIVCFIACNKKSGDAIENLAVNNFIASLESNQSDLKEIPDFSWEDIPALLAYKDETNLIKNYPNNPISSFYASECSLGTYALWAIESIRAVAIDSENLIGRFPSLNPILSLKSANESEFIDSKEGQEIAAKAYFDWWENNKDKDFNEVKNIDPLEETILRWR